MKFLDILLERYEDDYGYRDESLDNRDRNFICYTSGEYAIVNDPTTNTIYGVRTENIDSDYEYGAYEWESEEDYDRDDEGYSSITTNHFKEFNDTELDPEGIAFFVEDSLEDCTDDLDKFENGNNDIVRLTKENKKAFYEFFHDEIHDYIDSSNQQNG